MVQDGQKVIVSHRETILGPYAVNVTGAYGLVMTVVVTTPHLSLPPLFFFQRLAPDQD